jgi:hypothetical protein
MRLVWSNQVTALFTAAEATGYPLSSFLIGVNDDDIVLYKRGGKRRPYIEVARESVRENPHTPPPYRNMGRSLLYRDGSDPED